MLKIKGVCQDYSCDKYWKAFYEIVNFLKPKLQSYAPIVCFFTVLSISIWYCSKLIKQLLFNRENLKTGFAFPLNKKEEIGNTYERTMSFHHQCNRSYNYMWWHNRRNRTWHVHGKDFCRMGFSEIELQKQNFL